MNTLPKNYEQANKLLANRKSKKVANHTYLIRLEHDSIALKYHETNILVYYNTGERGAIYFTNCDEFRTVSTKERLDSVAAKHGIRIVQEKFHWKVIILDNNSPTKYVENRVFSYCEGFIIQSDGTVTPSRGVDTPVKRTRRDGTIVNTTTWESRPYYANV